MPDVTRNPHLAAFLSQFDGLNAWLKECLASAGITGTTATRAMTRLGELASEVEEIHNLITVESPKPDGALPVPLDYEKLDAAQVFPAELAKRADAGIQDLAAGIQDDLAGIARERKKQLKDKQGPDAKQDRATMKLWFAMNACDCIEEIAATAYRLAEAARYLFQMEYVVVLTNQPAQE